MEWSLSRTTTSPAHSVQVSRHLVVSMYLYVSIYLYAICRVHACVVCTPPSSRTPELGLTPDITPVTLAAALAAAATVNELVVAFAGEGACGARSGRGDGDAATGPGSGRAT